MGITKSQQAFLEIVERGIGFSLKVLFFEHELSVHEAILSGKRELALWSLPTEGKFIFSFFIRNP